MPLIWTSGYLGRALVVMETVCSEVTDVKLSKEVVSIYKDNMLNDWNDGGLFDVISLTTTQMMLLIS